MLYDYSFVWSSTSEKKASVVKELLIVAVTNFFVQFGLEKIDGRIFLTDGKFKSNICWYNQDYTRWKIMLVVEELHANKEVAP